MLSEPTVSVRIIWQDQQLNKTIMLKHADLWLCASMNILVYLISLISLGSNSGMILKALINGTVCLDHIPKSITPGSYLPDKLCMVRFEPESDDRKINVLTTWPYTCMSACACVSIF